MTKKALIESYAVWLDSTTNKAAFHMADVERMLDKYSDQQNKQLKEAVKKIENLPIYGEGYISVKEVTDIINKIPQ